MTLHVRAPGRVNLIGEHTDYNGYPVLPMAIDRAAHLDVEPRTDGLIALTNVRTHFTAREWDLAAGPAPFAQGDWAQYTAAAVAGVLEAGLVDRARARGFSATVDGRIPIAAGLSSSSALLVASALAFCAVNDVNPDRHVLADICAHAERWTGLEGGGMDQAVSLLAEEGCALRIDFSPLRARTVPIPAEAVFVICDSRVEAAKSAGARDAYNLRVAECRAASALLERVLLRDDRSSSDEPSSPDEVLSSDEPSSRDEVSSSGIPRPVQLLAALRPTRSGVPDDALLDAARTQLPAEPLTPTALAELLGWDPARVERQILTVRDGSVVPVPREGLRVRDRALHVLNEAGRVEVAEQAMRNDDLESLGSVMNASHASCRDHYDVSCPELEALVSAARRSGALGARLTGAGFGGCTVNLVRARALASFLDAMRREVRTLHMAHGEGQWSDVALESMLFVARPAAGASLGWLPMEGA